DRSAGKGQFRLEGDIEPFPGLDEPADADGSVALSTFQPTDGNPTDGAWEAFTKYGKLGPDFGLENVFKRPIIVLRPGASFRTPVPRGWLGRAIPMDELLAQDVVGKLRNLDVQVIHWAFGLCVPLRWPKGQIHSSEPIAEPIAIEESPLLPPVPPTQKRSPRLEDAGWPGKHPEVRHFMERVTDEVPQVVHCATFYFNPDLPERTRFRIGREGIEGIYSNGTYTVKFRVETTANTPGQQAAVVAALNEWLNR
ncbi:MAG: hypothetical protein NZO58_07470, partial [Gemmataceae bacterium]|nr:hypothetical protein [Gemmataceae bacterium]